MHQVKDFLATCRKYGIKPGFYYSLATNTYLNVEGGEVQTSPILPGQVCLCIEALTDNVRLSFTPASHRF